MQIVKNNFFWYLFCFTTIIVSIYFFTFSDRINHHKFVQDKLSGDILLKTYYDYKNLKKNIDLYEDFFPSDILKKNEFQYHINNIFAKIIRFTQTNKNYKYEYKDHKKLNKKEFKELEKILNNISLEGAYFLTPKHLDKVTVNLFTSKSTQKEKFLNYYKFIIDREVEKYMGSEASMTSLAKEQSYTNLIAEVNLIRKLNYEFLYYIYDEIRLSSGTKQVPSLNFIATDIEVILDYLQCPFFEIESIFDPMCKIIDVQTVEKIYSIYKALQFVKPQELEMSQKQLGPTIRLVIKGHHSIELQEFETTQKQESPRLDIKVTSYQDRSLFDKLVQGWTVKNGYNDPEYYYILSKAFSKRSLQKVQQTSELRQIANKLNKNYDHRYFNSRNYNTESLKEKIFSSLKEVETKKNYFELLSFIIFALIFSLTANIVYRSFSDKK